MQQVEIFANGERDYTKLIGDTGPIVYPAGHLYIYTALYHVTEHGQSIHTAQVVFAALWVLALGLVLHVARRSRMIPRWAMPLFALSKRARSLFVLRLFN